MPRPFAMPEPLVLEPGGLLTESDREALANAIQKGTNPNGGPPTGIEKLRASHHQVARLVADNVADAIISAVTGYTVQRLAHLKTNPAFLELVSFYSGEISDVQAEVVSRMKAVALDAIEVVHERILERPDDIKMSDLDSLLKTFLDRSGNGPTTKNVNVTATGTIADIRDALAGPGVTIRAARTAGASPAIDYQPPVGGVGPTTADEGSGEGSEGDGPAVRTDAGENDAEGTGA